MQDILVLSMVARGSLVFEKICIVDVYMYFYGYVDVCLVHSGDERF